VAAPAIELSAEKEKHHQSAETKQDILKTPTAQLGDDFDVEW